MARTPTLNITFRLAPWFVVFTRVALFCSRFGVRPPLAVLRWGCSRATQYSINGGPWQSITTDLSDVEVP